MENFFLDEKFYSDLGDLMDDLDINEECDSIEDDWSVEVREGSLEPIVQIDSEWIMDRINEERFTEEGKELEKINALFNEHIDFKSINEKMPKLYYPRAKFTITKQHLLEWVS